MIRGDSKFFLLPPSSLSSMYDFYVQKICLVLAAIWKVETQMIILLLFILYLFPPGQWSLKVNILNGQMGSYAIN